MSSSENSKPLPPQIKPPPTRKELQASLAKKLAAMDPKDRDLLLRLERARRGLPIAKTNGESSNLADLIAAVPDTLVATVAERVGIRVGDRTPPVLRTLLLLRHEDQVREAVAGAGCKLTPYPPPQPEDEKSPQVPAQS